jgi:hypothetical protein
MKYKLSLAISLAITGMSSPVVQAAGIFAPAAGQAGSTAVAAGSPAIRSWASGIVDYTAGANVDLGFQTPGKALGQAGNSDGSNAGYNYDIVSLGNGGSITLSFATPIANGAGNDFAVFENSFSDTFLELAWVEVSSNGSDFTRFPAFSLTGLPVSAFGSMDPGNVEGVAGKYRGGYGTPFDLEQLSGTPGLDLGNIGYVRLVDIVGDGSAPNDLTPQALADWLNISIGLLPPALFQIADNAPAAIFDPYPTVGSGGFDLDAVGAMNLAAVPLPASMWLLATGLGSLGFGLRKARRGRTG